MSWALLISSKSLIKYLIINPPLYGQCTLCPVKYYSQIIKYYCVYMMADMTYVTFHGTCMYAGGLGGYGVGGVRGGVGGGGDLHDT
jgi:hypothetical protein